MRDGTGFDLGRRHVSARVRDALAEVIAGPSAEDARGPAAAGSDARYSGLGGVRDPARRSALAIGCAVLVAAVATGIWVLSSRPRAEALQTGSRPSSATSPLNVPRAVSGSRSPTPSGLVVVDIAGRVRHPGLYRLASGARVDDAVRAAGGLLPGVSEAAVNRAARISDGQQIVVGTQPASVTGPSAGAVGSGGGGPGDGGPGGISVTPINVNTASMTELQQLPGVGPVLAQHIVDWRIEHGSFSTPEQLLSVSGIGPAKFAAMRALVAV